MGRGWGAGGRGLNNGLPDSVPPKSNHLRPAEDFRAGGDHGAGTSTANRRRLLALLPLQPQAALSEGNNQTCARTSFRAARRRGLFAATVVV